MLGAADLASSLSGSALSGSALSGSKAAVPAAFAGPQPYSVWWIVAAVLALVAVAAWLLGLWWWSRPNIGERRAISAFERARAETLSRIDRLIAASEAGQVQPREAYEQLSAIVREFATTATGLNVRTMTLADLRASGMPALPQLIAVLYPPEFGPAPSADPTPQLRSGRELVATWR